MPRDEHDFLHGLVTRAEGDQITIRDANGDEHTVTVMRSPTPEPIRQALEAYLWRCGCLVNDGGAHRVGCPEHREGVKGDRL
jgi:hypothetical protein